MEAVDAPRAERVEGHARRKLAGGRRRLRDQGKVQLILLAGEARGKLGKYLFRSAPAKMRDEQEDPWPLID